MARVDVPDEQAVYLALKDVFVGPAASIRNCKPIAKVLRKYETRKDVAILIKAHGLHALKKTIQILLGEEIFQSTAKAKNRFPQAFVVSPETAVQRMASEA